MPIPFQLIERLVGFCTNAAEAGGQAEVIFRELIGPEEGHLMNRLEQLQGCLFSKIPGLPPPYQINNLLIIINSDLSAVAYINELDIVILATPNRAIGKGEDVYKKDIADITSVDIGVAIPADAAFVLVQSSGWRRSLFYDFGPLNSGNPARTYSIENMLAQQSLSLLGIKQMLPNGPNRIASMEKGLRDLQALLDSRCEEEAKYQQILEDNKWMLAGNYAKLMRHAKMDDTSIPDFTAVRCYDECHDVIELKHPFLKLFKQDNNPSSDFNDSWNQAERYLDFCVRQRAYLLDQKKLRFENPRCILIFGYGLTEDQMRHVILKQGMSKVITVITYDQLISMARHLLNLVKDAGDGIQQGKK